MQIKQTWCQCCKESTGHKLANLDGKYSTNGNNRWECLVCGCINHTIQGFNSNLM